MNGNLARPLILLIPEETGTEQMDAQKERLCILFACLT